MKENRNKSKDRKNTYPKSLAEQLNHLARQSGGSHKTVHDRIHIMNQLHTYLKTNNIQIKEVAHLKAKHIQGYIEYKQEMGISKRTLQNHMSAIRVTLKRVGRDKLAESEHISNQTLKIHNASRDGTRRAITTEEYQQVLEQAQTKDAGLAATIQLARTLGLRSEEAVQSMHSLKTWQKEISQGKTKLTVIFGTKGGRPRQTQIINKEQVREVIATAINIANKQNGKLINKPNLKQAMTYWHNQTTRIGLIGQISPHSLRYAWAQEAIQYYQEQGYNEKEALALTSMNLGHGDGRGRYIRQVYNQKFG